MARVKSENAVNRSLDYSLVRHLIVEGPDYSSNMAENHSKNQGTISEYLSNLQDIKVVEKERKGQKVVYSVSFQGLAELQADLLELEEPFSDNFIENYVRNYCSLNRSSTVRDMLRDDFVSIFSVYSEYNDVPEFLEDFLERPRTKILDHRYDRIAEESLNGSMEL